MYFDDTTLTNTNTEFEEDKILILDGKARLKYFEEQYHSKPVLSPLTGKTASLLKKLKQMLKR
jgi:hypothetical protein